jgi:AcrR family transcriptional regulator
MAARKAKRGPPRRDEALSRDRIVETAIELLDELGDEGLTFRALATRLATGAGALYWHIENKDQLLDAATDILVDRLLAKVSVHAAPKKAIRDVAMAVFETIDAHPWMGAQLIQNPPPIAMLKIFERIGQQLQALRVARDAQFTAATVLGSYIISESRQNAANGRLTEPPPDRHEFLDQAAASWQQLDAQKFPFTRDVASRLREHDDRAEFLAGVDLILAGIAAHSPRSR